MYETDSVAALAAYKIVLFTLWRSRAFAKVKLICYNAADGFFDQKHRRCVNCRQILGSLFLKLMCQKTPDACLKTFSDRHRKGKPTDMSYESIADLINFRYKAASRRQYK